MIRISGAAAGAAAVAASLAVTSAAAVQPDFAPNASVGWYAYARVFIAPESGPGPVPQDPAHPLVSNDEFRATGRQATFPMGDPNAPILKPSTAEAIRKINQTILSGKPVFSLHATCRPAGVPDFLLLPMTIPMYVVQGRKEVLLILEDFGDVRRVYLDVPHSAHPKPSWYGESVGHYEGDTLVVDTIGFNDRTPVDHFLTPHTDQLHVVERYHLMDGGKLLEVNVHVEDPGAFTMPWNATQRFRQYEALASSPNVASLAVLATPEQGPLIEAVCAENPNSLMGLSPIGVPQADVPDF